MNILSLTGTFFPPTFDGLWILCIIIITNYIKFKYDLRSNAAVLTDKLRSSV